MASYFRQRLEMAGALTAARAICDANGVKDLDVLTGPWRYKGTAMARHELMAWLRRHTAMSYPDLGRLFEKDHTSVVHAVQKIARVAAERPEVYARQQIPKDGPPGDAPSTRFRVAP